MEATSTLGPERRQRRKASPSDRPGPPSWAQLPDHRRRRLIAVLGDLVLRVRSSAAGADETTERATCEERHGTSAQ
jgi:hypothetical protein